MRLSLHLLQHFIDISRVFPEKIYETLNQIGLEVDEMQHVAVPEGVIVAQILKISPHKNANNLRVCEVDIGEKTLQIVCGAQNPRENDFVALATVGTTLLDPKNPQNPKKISETVIRGVTSHGMLCADYELGLPKISDGILILDSSIGELVLGRPLREYGIFNTHWMTLSITPNRGDCLCVLGVARDLKAALNLPMKSDREHHSDNQIGIGRVFQVVAKNKISSDLMFKVVDLKQQIMPLNIALNLAHTGFLGSSVTQNFMNFARYMTGVIFCAYDASEKKNDEIFKIFVEKNADGFDEIFDESGQRLCIVGAENAPDPKNSATRVIFQASYTPPLILAQNLHRTQQKFDQNLTFFTTRGSNPDLRFGMNFLHFLFSKIAFIYSDIHEICQNEPQRIIRASISDLTRQLGFQISRDELTKILKQLGFAIDMRANDDFFNAISPLYRHDIESNQDLAEEILRIFGIDKIPLIPHETTERTSITPELITHNFCRELISRALHNGFTESVGYVFYKKERLAALNFPIVLEDLINPINSELNTLRTSLLPNLIDTAENNENFGVKNIRLVEIGAIFDTNRTQKLALAMLVSGEQRAAVFPHPKPSAWNFYAFCDAVRAIIGDFCVENFSDIQDLPKIFHPYHGGDIFVRKRRVGRVSKALSGLKNCFVCEIDLDEFLRLQNLSPAHFQILAPFSKLPKTFRDLTVKILPDVNFSEILHAIKTAKTLQNSPLRDFYATDIFPENEVIFLSLRAVLQSEHENLTDENIAFCVDEILKILAENFDATLKK